MPSSRDGVPGPNDGAQSRKSVALLAQDFELLVAVFDRQLGLSDQADSDGVAALRRAKAAAERGLRLTEQLARNIADNEEQ